MREPFLINPPKRLLRRKNPLGETLVTVGSNPMEVNMYHNAWFGNRAGHRRAALIRWGLVPKRRRKLVRKRRKSMRKINAWFGDSLGHRIAAFKGWNKGHHFKKSVYRSFHKIGGRRKTKHNPPIDLRGSLGELTNVGHWGPLAVTGGLSAITGAVVPGLLPTAISGNPWAKLGVQLVVAVGGGKLVERVVDSRHGQAWMIVGVSMVGYQLLKQFILQPYFPAFAVGLGEYNDYTYRDVSQEVGAFPNEVSAFPNEVSAYPGVGADQELVGSYPYDGRYGY